MTRYRLPPLIIFLGFLLLLPSCGKKAAPFIPQPDFSFRVVHLTAEKGENHILLKGNFDGFSGTKKATGLVKGCRVYFAQYPINHEPCAACPIEYHGYQGFGPEVITEEGFRCNVPGKIKGQTYYFKVHLIGSKDNLGPPSNRARLVLE